MIALLDTTILSNFALVGRLELLKLALSETEAIVEEVLAEYDAGVQLGRVPPVDWSWLLVLGLGESERAMDERLRLRLSPDEAACLAAASSRGYRVFTDDRMAREIAAQLRIPVSGTLGLLARLVDQGHLTMPQADDVLRQMVAMGYRSPIMSLAEIM